MQRQSHLLLLKRIRKSIHQPSTLLLNSSKALIKFINQLHARQRKSNLRNKQHNPKITKLNFLHFKYQTHFQFTTNNKGYSVISKSNQNFIKSPSIVFTEVGKKISNSITSAGIIERQHPLPETR